MSSFTGLNYGRTIVLGDGVKMAEGENPPKPLLIQNIKLNIYKCCHGNQNQLGPVKVRANETPKAS